MINNLNTVPDFYKMAEQMESNDSESVLTIPEDLLNKPNDEKLNYILQVCINNSAGIDHVNSELKTINDKLCKNTLQELEKLAIKEQIQVTQGKIARLEKHDQELSKKVVDLRELINQNSVVFYNVEEVGTQSPVRLRELVYKIMTNRMEIPLDDVFSRVNPAGEIRITDAYRLGNPSSIKIRPLIITLISKFAKDSVLSKMYTDKLREDKIRVSEHFAPETKEKRFALIDKMKELRKEEDNKNKKVVIAKGNILIDNRVQKTERFEKNPLAEITHLSTNYFTMKHTEEHSSNNSHFQGHKLTIQSVDQAIAARNALFSNPYTAQADHIMYAYKYQIKREEDKDDVLPVIGYSDDQETTSGKIISDIIEQSGKSNIFISVTRKKDGGNIGPDRFNLIRQCAQEAILLPDNIENIDSLFRNLQIEH